MDTNLNRNVKSSRLVSIFEDVSEKIEKKIYGPGKKLPSLRKFAEEQRISKSSAVEVYERLVANGFVEARGQRGFFVKRPVKRAQDYQINDAGLRVRMPDSIRQRGHKFHPSGGWVDPALLPSSALRSAIRDVSRTRLNDLMECNRNGGYIPLRTQLADRLTSLGIDASPDNVAVTDSATMGIDLICRIYLKPGDTILVDDPTWLDFLALQRTHSVTVLGVPFKDGRRDLGVFKELVARHNPKLYILNSNFQNPTGTCLSTRQAFELLSTAHSSDLIFVEDDVYADFDTGSCTRLATLAGLKDVIYVSSFSKTISPSIRCGYICGETSVIKRLNMATLETGFGLNSLTSQIVHKFLQSGRYRRSVSSLTKSVDEARQSGMELLRGLGFEIPQEPNGGVFIWARWSGRASAKCIAEVASVHGVALEIGPSFSPNGAFEKYIRFNCTLMQSPVLHRDLKRILAEAEVAATESSY